VIRFTLQEFIRRWQKSQLTERSASQSHFIDLCQVLNQPTPAESDSTGGEYTFEKGAAKTAGGAGFADVWKRGYFAWEYKGKRKDLSAAYEQLLGYREDLENPPLLIVCDLNRFEVHTNFTRTPARVFAFTLADLAKAEPTTTCPIPPLDVLRAIFEDPDRLRPDQTRAYVTRSAAAKFAELAQSVERRGHDPHTTSRFLIRLLFCLFAEDVGLLPDKLLTQLLEKTYTRPPEFGKRLSKLFASMADGGSFGVEDIKHFNGGLFTDSDVLPLTRDELETLQKAARLDWSGIEPSIFGTLFERSLNPNKRAQLGAHYTSRQDIELIVEPVLMTPLRRRWAEVRKDAEVLITKRNGNGAGGPGPMPRRAADDRKLADALNARLQAFAAEIAAIRVLDPACGSGNFLYVALRALLDLQSEVIAFAIEHDAGGFFPTVGPEQMHGIEINEYARELAPVTVSIGYIQWLKEHGYGEPGEPILRAMDAIAGHDAILTVEEDGRLTRPEWPDADVVIGNPPFLGDKKMRAELGDEYVDRLRSLYEGLIPGGADLVTYWFEQARSLIESGRVKRAGLLSTNSIRTGSNRTVLERIKETGDIFMAWSDRAWVLDGAAVRVSMVGFDDGTESNRILDGVPRDRINTDLSGEADVTGAGALKENEGLCFLGMMKGGAFDIDGPTARAMLAAPLNPNGRPNSDVVRRRLGAQDITGRPRDGWIIDFIDQSEEEASYYEIPFAYLAKHVKPKRVANEDRGMKTRWWLHGRSRPALRSALAGMKRCIVTPEVAKHRLFVWMDTDTIPDHTCHVFGRDDEYFFGVLHSHVHELWTLRQCTYMGVGNDPRYTQSTTFDTFPFPWPPKQESREDARVIAIGEAARSLVSKRDAWLNPPGASAKDLSTRTLTALYNQRPSWLVSLHEALDVAVLLAYGWPTDIEDAELLERLLALNHTRTEVKTD
jgi:type II restriction/modification system DNA methylase subunit YeeA